VKCSLHRPALTTPAQIRAYDDGVWLLYWLSMLREDWVALSVTQAVVIWIKY